MKVLLRFGHGLGDAVQLTSVLRHLRRDRADWDVDVASLVGKHSAFFGLCRRSLVLDRDVVDPGAYDRVFALDWHECDRAYRDSASTKGERCLREVFGITPDLGLAGYRVQIGAVARERAGAYLREIAGEAVDGGGGGGKGGRQKAEGGRERAGEALDGVAVNGNGDDGGRERFPVAVIHYQGNTSQQQKDLPHEAVKMLCDDLIGRGLVPVVLDWDRRSPLVDGKRIHCPGVNHPLWGGTGTGDAEAIAALIDQAAIMVGIDSGPQKVAGATRTPTLAVWTKHHPPLSTAVS